MYIRMSIWAQSWLSVPPAPELIFRMKKVKGIEKWLGVDLQNCVHRVLLLAQHIAQFECLDGFDRLVVKGVHLLFADNLVFEKIHGE